MPEYYDVLDENRAFTGRTQARGTKKLPGEYNVGCELFVFTPDGRLLITRRHPQKHVYPGLWECTGGMVSAGETSRGAMLREAREELGLELAETDIRFIATELWGQQFLDMYMAVLDIDPAALTLQPDEVTDARLVDLSALKKLKNSGEFVEDVYKELMCTIKYVPNFWQKTV